MFRYRDGRLVDPVPSDREAERLARADLAELRRLRDQMRARFRDGDTYAADHFITLDRGLRELAQWLGDTQPGATP